MKKIKATVEIEIEGEEAQFIYEYIQQVLVLILTHYYSNREMSDRGREREAVTLGIVEGHRAGALHRRR